MFGLLHAGSWSRRLRGILLSLLMSGAVVQGAHADAAADFYKSRTIRVYSPFDPSGGLGLLVQLVSRFFGRNMAGQPTVVPQFMPGGGGIVQANYIYNVAPKDGTAFGLLFDNLPTVQVTDPTGIKFDAKRFVVVGALNSGEPGILVIRSDSAGRDINLAKQHEVLMAMTGPGTTGYTIGSALNKTIGTKFRFVMGYTGAGVMYQAFERNEVEALLLEYNSVIRDSPAMIQSGLMKWMLQIGARRHRDMPDVPLLTDLAENDQQKAIFSFLSASRLMGKAFVAPPETPTDRAEALRAGFQAMLVDPAFVDEATRLGMKVEPRPWQAVADVIRETVDLDPEIAATVRKLTAAPN
jgi:tripartite-type tricarboxylate transporter receptor subunit TctC